MPKKSTQVATPTVVRVLTLTPPETSRATAGADSARRSVPDIAAATSSRGGLLKTRQVLAGDDLVLTGSHPMLVVVANRW